MNSPSDLSDLVPDLDPLVLSKSGLLLGSKMQFWLLEYSNADASVTFASGDQILFNVMQGGRCYQKIVMSNWKWNLLGITEISAELMHITIPLDQD
jgi:hypothetical protein